MTGGSTNFSAYETCDDIRITVADGSVATTAGLGDILLPGFPFLHVPDLKCNLISISKLTKDYNCAVTF